MVASIEAPFTFLQEPVEIVGFDAIKFAQLALGLIPEILNAVDMIFAFREQLAVVDAPMVKA